MGEESDKFWFINSMNTHRFYLSGTERDGRVRTDTYENPFGYKVLHVISKSSPVETEVRIIMDQDDVSVPYFDKDTF